MALFPKVFIAALLLLTIVGTGWLFARDGGIEISSQIAGEQESPLPTQSPPDTIVGIDTVSVKSPDGKREVITTTTTRGDSSVDYRIETADADGGNKKILLEKRLTSDHSLFAPDNAWSPDNRYVLLKEINSGVASYYVFNANGDKFTEDRDYIDVLPIFEAKETGNRVSDITGWDSDTLLHVFTITGDENVGPAYWFEIPSGAVIRLASR